MTVTIGTAFDNLGFRLDDTETVAIVRIRDGMVSTRRLQDVRDEPIGANTYYATGTFPVETTFRHKRDRAATNVQRILELPFDFDLKDFLHVDKHDLYDLDDAELTSYIELLRSAVEGIFDQLNLPVHRLDMTGYGLSAHILLPAHDRDTVPALREIHAGIVAKINSIFGGTFADPAVSDAGSRIMRLVPCDNIGTRDDGTPAPARPSCTLFTMERPVTEAMLRAASDTIAWQDQPQRIPESGDGLSSEDAQAIIAAMTPHHTPGQRHYVALALAGMLGKARIPEAQAQAIIDALPADRANLSERTATVADTYAKLRAGVPVSGFYRLQGIVPDEVITTVDTVLEQYRQTQGPRLVFMQDHRHQETPDGDSVRLFNPPVPPREAFHGWHGRWLDLVYPTTAAANAFHLAASTTLQAALMGRRIATIYAGSRVYPSQYSLVVGPTGSSFKDTAYNRTRDTIEAAQTGATSGRHLLNTPFHEIRDVGSREGVIRSLSRQNNLYLFATEMTAVLKNANRESTSTLLDALITIWDSPAMIQNNSIAAAQEGTNIAYEPTMTIYGGIQPKRLADQMTEEMMTSGLGNRLAIFMGNGRGKLPRTPRLDLETAVAMYHELRHAIGYYPTGAELELTDAAGKRWDEWFMAMPEETEEIAADMRVRYPVMIQKWALLFAVCDMADAIEREHIDAAIALGDWMWSCVKQFLPGWGTSTERKIEERVMAVLDQRQPITRRDLARYVRGKWTSREVANVLKSLVDTGQIIYSADKHLVSTTEYADQHRQGGT